MTQITRTSQRGKKPCFFFFALLLIIFAQESLLAAQSGQDEHHQHPGAAPSGQKQEPESSMPGMQMDHRDQSMGEPETFVEEILHHATPGTSAEPNTTQEPMLMRQTDNWLLMFHGAVFLNDQQQSGPRGYDKFFSTSWFMPMAQRKIGSGQITLRTMVSLDPATVTQRFYPELFQQGETAFGKPINDGQHPHDLFMEIAALYDHKIGEHGLLSFYAAPVGDPAMGPAAFEHRVTASENPLAALGHHLEDSTHIANDVITGGVTYKSVRIEASGFHGREPDEFRWNVDSGAIDSWSSRLTFQPGQNWSTQYSIAHLTSPEQLHANEDVRRMTASVMYNRLIKDGSWSSLLLWGRNHILQNGENFNGYLLESTLRFAKRNAVWTRLENVDRTTELLLGTNPEPANFDETFLARIQAYSFGYDHDFPVIPQLSTALGAQVTFYQKPGFLTPIYGEHPAGVIVFLRIRPVGSMHMHH
jgi:hypothetical protein